MSHLSDEIKSMAKSCICPREGCGKIFSKPSNLLQHLRIHSGEKPHSCNICNKSFGQLGNLTKHIRSHENAHLRWNRLTKDKPFKCPKCERSFTANSSLQNHLRMHTSDVSDDNKDDYKESLELLRNETEPEKTDIVVQSKRDNPEQIPKGCSDLSNPRVFRRNEELATENSSLRSAVHQLVNLLVDLSKEEPTLHDKLAAIGFDRMKETVSTCSPTFDELMTISCGKLLQPVPAQPLAAKSKSRDINAKKRKTQEQSSFKSSSSSSSSSSSLASVADDCSLVNTTETASIEKAKRKRVQVTEPTVMATARPDPELEISQQPLRPVDFNVDDQNKAGCAPHERCVSSVASMYSANTSSSYDLATSKVVSESASERDRSVAATPACVSSGCGCAASAGGPVGQVHSAARGDSFASTQDTNSDGYMITAQSSGESWSAPVGYMAPSRPVPSRSPVPFAASTTSGPSYLGHSGAVPPGLSYLASTGPMSPVPCGASAASGHSYAASTGPVPFGASAASGPSYIRPTPVQAPAGSARLVPVCPVSVLAQMGPTPSEASTLMRRRQQQQQQRYTVATPNSSNATHGADASAYQMRSGTCADQMHLQRQGATHDSMGPVNQWRSVSAGTSSYMDGFKSMETAASSYTVHPQTSGTGYTSYIWGAASPFSSAAFENPHHAHEMDAFHTKPTGPSYNPMARLQSSGPYDASGPGSQMASSRVHNANYAHGMDAFNSTANGTSFYPMDPSQSSAPAYSMRSAISGSTAAPAPIVSPSMAPQSIVQSWGAPDMGWDWCGDHSMSLQSHPPSW